MEDYKRILEDLRNKRERIEEAIEAITRLLEVNGEAVPGVGKSASGGGMFAGMTVAEAARKYLSIIKRPAPTKEIVEALERGGLQHNAKDFYASVYAILRQQAQRDKAPIRRNALDWELVEETVG